MPLNERNPLVAAATSHCVCLHLHVFELNITRLFARHMSYIILYLEYHQTRTRFLCI